MKSSNVGNSITPPPELVQQWTKLYEDGKNLQSLFYGIFKAGANQELEACCEVLARELICDGKHVATDLRMIRRPKPPSLKERALESLHHLEAGCMPNIDLLRLALEQLPDEQ
jgi:hypothetical protein